MKRLLFIGTTIIIFGGLLCFFAASVFITKTNNLSLAKDTVMEMAQAYARLYSLYQNDFDTDANTDPDASIDTDTDPDTSIYYDTDPDTSIDTDTDADTDAYADANTGISKNVNLAEFVETGSDTRITIIGPDGVVLADSRPLELSAIENHLVRPEIQAAAQGAPSAHVRRSATLGVDYIYYALKTGSEDNYAQRTGGEDNYVFVRVSVPVAKIDGYLSQSIPVLAVLLIALALICHFLVRSLANHIVKPFASIEHKLRLLSNGEFAQSPDTGSYEEIEAIAREIDDISLVLKTNIDELSNEKNKLAYILDNMGDGLFVVDENKSVTLINSAALNIFGATPDIVGKKSSYLTFDNALSEAVDECVRNANSALLEIALNGNIFLISVKRLPGTELTMAALTNVTENRENAKLREEFFANASHELKTPLTAIKGFNELTLLHNSDESLKKYIAGIARETERMTLLIGDMLKLSELESTLVAEPVSLSLAKVIDGARESVSAAIAEKSIVFEAKGDAVVKAEQEHLYELVKNLVENAVRYNSENGKVSVIAEKLRRGVRLTVRDNGIGISPEEQSRIFERFYRVEKSRSVKSGGTGLGLSIVKHICALYGWKLALRSRPGVGTDVVVDFGYSKSKSGSH